MRFTVKGIHIRLNFWFFAILALFFLLSDPRIRLMAFLAVLIHESGHLIALFLFGVKPREVALKAFGISISYDENRMAYKKDIAVTAAGPIANLTVFAVTLPMLNSGETVAALCWFNLGLCVLNLFPVRPLDGYHIVELLFKNYSAGGALRIVFDALSLTINIILFILSVAFILTGRGNVTLAVTSFMLLLMQIISFKR